jgi:hypothetical protein
MPTAPALPAGSTLGHTYEYGIDVNLGTEAIPIWQLCRRISDFQPNITPITEDSATYDDFGSPNADKTGESWTVAFSILGNRSSSTGLYPAELEAILDRTKPSAKGEAAVLHVRYYHKPESGTPNPDDAFEGFATVGIQRANAGNTGVEKRTITLTGKGPRTEITNPFAGWDATAPTITSITPASAATGDQVTITGSSFVGTTDVTFGAIVADPFTIVSDTTIVATLPSDGEGEVDVVVTNGVGDSAAFAYTRGA